MARLRVTNTPKKMKSTRNNRSQVDACHSREERVQQLDVAYEKLPTEHNTLEDDFSAMFATAGDDLSKKMLVFRIWWREQAGSPHAVRCLPSAYVTLPAKLREEIETRLRSAMQPDVQLAAKALRHRAFWHMTLLDILGVFGADMCASRRFLTSLRSLEPLVEDSKAAMVALIQARDQRRNGARKMHMAKKSRDAEWQPMDVVVAETALKEEGGGDEGDRTALPPSPTSCSLSLSNRADTLLLSQSSPSLSQQHESTGSSPAIEAGRRNPSLPSDRAETPFLPSSSPPQSQQSSESNIPSLANERRRRPKQTRGERRDGTPSPSPACSPTLPPSPPRCPATPPPLPQLLLRPYQQLPGRRRCSSTADSLSPAAAFLNEPFLLPPPKPLESHELSPALEPHHLCSARDAMVVSKRPHAEHAPNELVQWVACKRGKRQDPRLRRGELISREEIEQWISALCPLDAQVLITDAEEELENMLQQRLACGNAGNPLRRYCTLIRHEDENGGVRSWVAACWDFASRQPTRRTYIAIDMPEDATASINNTIERISSALLARLAESSPAAYEPPFQHDTLVKSYTRLPAVDLDIITVAAIAATHVYDCPPPSTLPVPACPWLSAIDVVRRAAGQKSTDQAPLVDLPTAEQLVARIFSRDADGCPPTSVDLIEQPFHALAAATRMIHNGITECLQAADDILNWRTGGTDVVRLAAQALEMYARKEEEQVRELTENIAWFEKMIAAAGEGTSVRQRAEQQRYVEELEDCRRKLREVGHRGGEAESESGSETDMPLAKVGSKGKSWATALHNSSVMVVGIYAVAEADLRDMARRLQAQARVSVEDLESLGETK